MNSTRRAMLGDATVQAEFTRQWKMLPCPYCGSKWTQVRHMGMTVLNSGYRGECTDCFAITKAYRTPEEAVAAWNMRSTLVVFCKDCKYRYNCVYHAGETEIFSDYDFCSMGEIEREDNDDSEKA